LHSEKPSERFYTIIALLSPNIKKKRNILAEKKSTSFPKLHSKPYRSGACGALITKVREYAMLSLLIMEN
jgi:hypothetical protein